MFKSWRLMWYLDGWILCGDCILHCDWFVMAPVGETQDKWTAGKRSSWVASCSAEWRKLTLSWCTELGDLFVQWQGISMYLLPLYVFNTTCILTNPLSHTSTKTERHRITCLLSNWHRCFDFTHHLYFLLWLYLYSKPLSSICMSSRMAF